MRGGFFILVLVLMQVFTFGLGRSLQWLCAPLIGKIGRRRLMILAYLITNSLIVGLLLQVDHMIFRLTAFWMVLLLFVMYSALATFVVYLALRKFMAQPPLSRSLRLFAPLFLVGLTAFSVYNAYVPVVRYQSITINKKLAKPLRIGVASDLHLGSLVGIKQLDKLAALMKQEKVDLILLPGDLMDDDTKVYVAKNMQPNLSQLTAPLGVYATLGNHDLFGHQQEIRRELEKAGIRVLENEAVQDNGLLIVGRNDDMDKSRPSTAALLADKNTDLPVLLLDHRPSEIEQHAVLPVDIQVSGHVHNGQVAPANLIVSTLNRVAYGYESIGNGHYFVTSGYGFWGIPMRLGSQSEIWIIDVAGQ